MESGDLEELLADLRAVATLRDASELGTDERAELDDALLAVQNRIRYWSDDTAEDDAPTDWNPTVTGEGHPDLHAASEAALAAAGSRLAEPRDQAEDEEITREADAGKAASNERGDTGARLAEWRDAERAIEDTDPGSVEGEELRDDASKAHDAYTDAEHAQRQRHGIPDRKG